MAVRRELDAAWKNRNGWKIAGQTDRESVGRRIEADANSVRSGVDGPRQACEIVWHGELVGMWAYEQIVRRVRIERVRGPGATSPTVSAEGSRVAPTGTVSPALSGGGPRRPRVS